MHILQIAPAGVPVGPDSADPVGVTVHQLVDGLIDRGHEVTLWADPRSQTRARQIGNGRIPTDGSPTGFATFERLYAFGATAVAESFDIVHNHAGPTVAELLWRLPATSLSTRHDGRGSLPGPYVTTCWAGRPPAGQVDDRFLGVIYPGLPVDDLAFGEGEGGYLLYAAPVAPAFGIERALATACNLELPLRIAGAIPAAWRPYVERAVMPRLRPGVVDYLGPLSPQQIAEAAAHAIAVLYPARNPQTIDPGLIAAMAAGAPIVGVRGDAMAEVVAHAETGFLVAEPWELAGAVDAVDRLDRRACRERARRLFHTDRLIDETAALYTRLLRGVPGREERATHPELEALDPRPLIEPTVGLSSRRELAPAAIP